MQKIDDLLQGFLGFVLTGHILEGDAGLLFHVDLGLALAKAAHHAALAAAHASGEHIGDEEHTADHQRVAEHHHDAGVILHDGSVHGGALGDQRIGQLHLVIGGGKSRVAGLLLGGRLCRLLLCQIDDAVVLNFRLRDLTRGHGLPEIGPCGLVVLTFVDGAVDAADDKHRGHRDQKCDPDIIFRGLVVPALVGAVLGRILAIHIHVDRLLVFS